MKSRLRGANKVVGQWIYELRLPSFAVVTEDLAYTALSDAFNGTLTNCSEEREPTIGLFGPFWTFSSHQRVPI